MIDQFFAKEIKFMAVPVHWLAYVPVRTKAMYKVGAAPRALDFFHCRTLAKQLKTIQQIGRAHV